MLLTWLTNPYLPVAAIALVGFCNEHPVARCLDGVHGRGREIGRYPVRRYEHVSPREARPIVTGM
jgi:hypothetical protein